MKIYDWRKFITFIITVLFLIILVVATVICVKNEKQQELKAVEDYTIQSGETLWSIGSAFRPETMSIQEYIYKLEELNNITADIKAGTIIKVLIY